MLIDLGFAVNTSVDQYPIVDIELDGVCLVRDLALDQAGTVNDHTADLQRVVLSANTTDGPHRLRIQSININENFKTHGDFGFQLRSIKINNTDLEWFWKPTVSYNPVPNQGYLDHYIDPQNLAHEIEEHDGTLVHVRRGDFANYVNLPGGYIELDFVTPLYRWFLSNNFGNLTQNLIQDFT